MTQSKDTLVFNGFEPANTTPVPDVLFDVLLAYLNEAQLKVMLYIIRRTLGFKKTADAISLNQFRWGITTKEGKKLDDGCGLKNFTTISNALKELEQMNCIESDKRETDEGNKLTTVYRIRFRGTTQNGVGTTDNVVGVLRKTYDRTTSSGGRVLRKTESQETVIQETDKQQTDLQERESTAPESDTPTVSPPSVGALSLPGKTEEFVEKLREWRIEDEQQGDAHVDILPGSADGSDTLPSADMGDLPASGQTLRSLPPASRMALEAAQEEIGDAHGYANNDLADLALDHVEYLPGMPDSRSTGTAEGQPTTSKKGRDDGQLEQNTPTPTPAQALPPQSEQAALGQGKQQTLQAPEKRQSAKVEPLAEPDMSGKWSHEKCVEYAEWCNKRRYTDKMREEQLKAAQSIHKNDGALTLEQFKQAYDERNDAWWQEHKGKLHVNDMKAKGASGIDRVHEMLQRIEDAATRSKPRQISAVPRVRVFSSYDDPNFRSDQDFYPVEGGSYATAASV